MKSSRRTPLTAVAAAAVLSMSCITQAYADNLASCDSGAKENWQPREKLEKQLKDKNWQVRRIKVDNGCYEVYAVNDKGKRVEVYFHPVTLEAVPTKKP